MKSRITLICLLILTSIGLQAQYNTYTQLYDTISSGPFIEKEGSGYNLYFLTTDQGTMVSNRGMVTNPSMPYKVFNHYHIQETGQVDSIFSISVREEVKHHYTMYQRGAPKMLQFRVGTSNDPTFEKIKSKYPILGKVNVNDESLNLSTIEISNNAPFKYNLTNLEYHQGKVSQNHTKASIEAEEGWVMKDQLTAANIENPRSILTLAKVIENDKELKYNDLKEFRFLTLSEAGVVSSQEDITFERAYLSDQSGLVHDIDSKFAGYFLTLIEAGGSGAYKKANEDYNSALRKIILFDAQGKYEKELMLSLPFYPKSKEMGDQKILKIIKSNENHIVLLKTKGNKKQKIGEGIYTYLANGDEAKEVKFQKDIDLEIGQDILNKTEEMTSISDRYDYAVKLENGKLALIASQSGNDLKMIILDDKGNLQNTGTIYLANNIVGAQAKLSFEFLDNNRVLINSKVADEKSVKTSYSILDGSKGTIRNIQPTQKLNKFSSFRNGDDVIVFGYSVEDEKLYHFVLEKLSFKEAGITMGTN